MPRLSYTTPHGITVTRLASARPYQKGLKHLLRKLDRYRGFYLSSGYEYPERYSRWDVASICPPIEIVAAGREIEFRPLNKRGEVLNRILQPLLEQHPHWETFALEGSVLHGVLKPLPDLFPEEERSKQPSAFSILRAVIGEFAKRPRHATGAGGRVRLRPAVSIRSDRAEAPARRAQGSAALPVRRHLLHGSQEGAASSASVTISRSAISPRPGSARTGAPIRRPAATSRSDEITSDHRPEEYMAKVEAVREGMRQGDYYEVVLRQTFQANYSGSPSELFERIQKASPSPYEFFLQLGDEQLIGASPEMFVRVEGNRVETCPIAGTARRTGDPLRDADNIRELLNSTKEESELTMCSDVDRNDKSRVSIPGSVKVIGRRLIESYAGVFHTVDHVEGMLQPGFDSLDAFLTPHVGRDHHRRAQEGGRAGHRGSGERTRAAGTAARSACCR